MSSRTRNNRRRRQITVPEITLTPLIDTALTLLIIFMVTTPMIHNNAIKVDLPKGQAQEGGRDQQELTVTINQQGKIFFNNKSVTLDALGKTVKEHLAQSSQEKSIWVKIDANNTCDTLIGVIDRIKVIGGVKDVKVATQRPAAPAA